MIQVAAAIILNDEGRILIAKRKQGKSQGGLWEFPGGKLEEGESPEVCLIRELQEEMNINISPYAYFDTSDHRYGERQIQLIAYLATYVSGEIVLHDHDEYRWASILELAEFEFAPADIPFVAKLGSNPSSEFFSCN
ncbi:8-oxo-dGTP diphosphatase [Paenibacillus phyllosphaerae]|uniref:8-oxo-dGTP diphosphatase n=1 Tax=Paenibacillus phyllosphaerae TaxID=274593 RepID=A0A7W5FRP1_9BACL|nr:8-oxo-dGTP diphosphatase MutT [Paenibacillus phyllosphaerae]MBB3114553.1 8-oxo-dGTP diphosphatase [Paenibacillus phyllosphaerae]